MSHLHHQKASTAAGASTEILRGWYSELVASADPLTVTQRLAASGLLSERETEVIRQSLLPASELSYLLALKGSQHWGSTRAAIEACGASNGYLSNGASEEQGNSASLRKQKLLFPCETLHHSATMATNVVMRNPVCSEMEVFVLLFSRLVATLRPPCNGARCGEDHVRPRCELDIDEREIRRHFPASVRFKDEPANGGQELLRLSTVLEAFKQFWLKFQQLLVDKETADENLRRVKENNTLLRDQVRVYKQTVQDSPTGGQLVVTDLQIKLSDAEQQVRKIAPLKTSLAKVERDNKDLRKINEDWVRDCLLRDHQITDLVKDKKRLTQQVEVCHQRVHKYKQQHVKDTHSTAKFDQVKADLDQQCQMNEELGSQRDEARDQLQSVAKQNSILKCQLEEKEDLIEEQKDRIGNLKLQSQSREPSVREFSLLLEENRQLKEENKKLKQQNITKVTTGVLVEPSVQTEAEAKRTATLPKFYDSTPLIQDQQATPTSHTQLLARYSPTEHIPTLPPPPNQPTAILAPDSSLLHGSLSEHKCPKCHYSFFTLSAREFQSHVAGCFQ